MSPHPSLPLCVFFVLFHARFIDHASSSSWIPSSVSLPVSLSSAASATIDQHILYLFGGYHSLNDNTISSDKIYKYNSTTKSWSTLPITLPITSLPLVCYQCTAVINQTFVFIIVSQSNILIFDTVQEILIPSDFISAPLHPINTSAISVTNDQIGQFMFVISYQQSGVHSIAQLQRYNSYTNQWLPSRPFPFTSHGYTASVYYNGKLFVFGGHTQQCTDDDDNGDAVHCVLSAQDRICGYDLTTHIWQCYEHRLSENKYATSVVLGTGNAIYVIAGLTEDGYSTSIDAFDGDTCECSPLPPLPNIGGLVTASILHGQLYVFGGFNVSASPPRPFYDGVVYGMCLTFVHRATIKIFVSRTFLVCFVH